MKKIFLITMLGLFTLGLSAKAPANFDELWDEANSRYVNNDFAGAIAVYESILDQGYASSKLYYNLGNAYFKDNSIGKAILNYNKAQRIAPSDSYIEYNLAVANSYVKDRIDAVPQFFLNSWARTLRTSLSSNVWAVISLIFFTFALCFALIYVFSQKKSWRKAGFFTAVVMAIFFFMSVSFAVMEKNRLMNSSEAIVTAPAVAVKSSPNSAGTDLFQIHEGTKVEVLGDFGEWGEVMIADGNKGWLLLSAVEMID